ncbi:MAG: hypothetical protein ACOY15_12160 [Pseudomonadota bacterium]
MPLLKSANFHMVRSMYGSPPIWRRPRVGVHGLFAGKAYDELFATGARKIATCNTVAHPSNAIDVKALIAGAAEELLKEQKTNSSCPMLRGNIFDQV